MYLFFPEILNLWLWLSMRWWTNGVTNCYRQNGGLCNAKYLPQLVSWRCRRDRHSEGGVWGLYNPQGDSQAMRTCGDRPGSTVALSTPSKPGLAWGWPYMLWPGQVSPPSSFAAPISQQVSNPGDKIVPTHCPWAHRADEPNCGCTESSTCPLPSTWWLTCSYAVTPPRVQNFKEPGSLWASGRSLWKLSYNFQEKQQNSCVRSKQGPAYLIQFCLMFI